MDQIRKILRVLWQQRFWVLCSVGTLVAVFCWWIASGDLDKAFSKNKDTIKGKFKAMDNLVTASVLPNDDVNNADQEQTRLLQESVLELWDELYQSQRQVVLFWPKDHLHAEFIEAIDKLHFGDPFPTSKAVFMRNNYLNYIENRFDGLVEIIKARKVEGRGGRFGGRGMEGMGDEGGFDMRASSRGGRGTDDEDEDYLVEWLDQNDLRSQLNFPTQPTDLQIWVTQENLWVYETLLNVIANTNKQRGATRPDNAAVRIISALQVGRPAAQASRHPGSVMIPQAVGEEGGMGGRGMGMEGMGMEGMGREMGGFEGGRGMEGMGMGGMGRGEMSVDVLANRYVDAEGIPIEGAEPEDLGIEFRRLPVRMVLKVDQKSIPQFLIECANAALPVEVKRLRINPDQSGSGFQRASPGGRGGGMRGRTSADSAMDDTGFVEVEIQGVVYIYNEPNRERLEVPGIESI